MHLCRSDDGDDEDVTADAEDVTADAEDVTGQPETTTSVVIVVNLPAICAVGNRPNGAHK